MAANLTDEGPQTALNLLQRAIEKTPELADISVLTCEKAAANRSVFKAMWQGETVALKHYHTPLDGALAQQSHNILKQKHALMREPLLRVPKPIAVFDTVAITLRSYVEGTRLSNYLAAANSDQQVHVIRQSGNWLRNFIQDGTDEGGFGPRHWIEKIDQTAQSTQDQGMKSKLIRMKKILRQNVGALRGVPTPRCLSHGDYCALNMLIDGDVLNGIDIESSAQMARVRDVARFLVQAQVYSKPATQDTYLGLSKPFVDAFLAGFGPLTDSEAEHLFPFFIGEALAGRFAESQIGSQNHLRLALAVDQFLHGYGELTGNKSD